LTQETKQHDPEIKRKYFYINLNSNDSLLQIKKV